MLVRTEAVQWTGNWNTVGLRGTASDPFALDDFFVRSDHSITRDFDNHPLERRFRDIHTVTQQLQGQLKHFETVGAWIMGADTDLTYV